ncbi:MAG: hypothetical protein M3R02_05225 [Chloroflexota bacterium]|nr:hypothetical protein [Chloroflexota bacterium]
MLRDLMHDHDGEQNDRHRTECQKLDLQELIWQNQKMADAVQADADTFDARREWQITKLLPAVIACLRDAADATNQGVRPGEHPERP